jgi:hypothetical protein
MFQQQQLQRCYPTSAISIYSFTWTRETAMIIKSNTFKIASANTLICLNIFPAALDITSTIRLWCWIYRGFTDTILCEQMIVSSINTTEATCHTINTKRTSESWPVLLALDLVSNRNLRRCCRRHS